MPSGALSWLMSPNWLGALASASGKRAPVVASASAFSVERESLLLVTDVGEEVGAIAFTWRLMSVPSCGGAICVS